MEEGEPEVEAPEEGTVFCPSVLVPLIKMSITGVKTFLLGLLGTLSKIEL
jgi:hypothetical protein